MINVVSTRRIGYIDKLHWLVYLALVTSVSFLNSPYLSESWLTYSIFFYGFISSYSVSVILGARCNAAALHNARYAIALCFISLLWLWLQSILPINNYLSERVFADTKGLGWFDPVSTWSATPDKTRWLLLGNLAVVSLFVASLCLIDSRRRVKQLLVLFLLVGSVHALIGVTAKYANVHLVALSQIDGHYDAARAWFVNRNHFASFISLCLVGGLSFQLKALMNVGSSRLMPHLMDQVMSVRVFFMLSLLLGVLAIILSQSRAGFLAIVLSVFVLLLIRKKPGHALPRRRLIVSGLVAILLMLIYFGEDLLTRFSQDTFSAGERIDQWSITWQAIKHQLILGYGGGSYATVFQVFRDVGDLRQVVYDQAHNEYLHIWLEQGLIGLLLWLGFLGAALTNALSTTRKHPSRLVVALSYAGLTVMLAALLQAWIGYNLQITNIRSYFFVIMALLFAAPTVRHQKR